MRGYGNKVLFTGCMLEQNQCPLIAPVLTLRHTGCLLCPHHLQEIWQKIYVPEGNRSPVCCITEPHFVITLRIPLVTYGIGLKIDLES